MPLTLYRRHKVGKVACKKGYPQHKRIFEPQTERERKKDCECPIVASGTLRLETKRIQHVSTETNDWDQARKQKEQWESWGALTNPNPSAVVEDQNVTVDEAAERFLKLKGAYGQNLQASTLGKYRVLLDQRIKPFCIARGIQFIKAFDNPTTVTDCFLTFRNLNPHRNRKNQPAIVKPLGDQTKRAELEYYRAFLRFCQDQGWLRYNHASKIKLGKLAPSPKFGLLPEEEQRVWDAVERTMLRRQTGQYNAKELRVLCLVMRHAGLRISDAVALNDSQLVPRVSGKGWAIAIMYQLKTGEPARIPIPDFVAEALQGLEFKGEKDGKRYWFYSGNGGLDTAVNNWRERLANLFKLAQKDKPFEHPASSHTWRHTFAISMLNHGADIKMVSRWLGHTSIRVTEAHYAHANRATHVASEQAYDEAMERMRESSKPRLVGGGRSA